MFHKWRFYDNFTTILSITSLLLAIINFEIDIWSLFSNKNAFYTIDIKEF
jgi:hypothetical protein